MKIQPKVKGGREPLPSTVLPRLRRAVEADAQRFNVSRSWVVAVALAEVYGIDVPSFLDRPRKRRRATAR